MVLMQSLVRKIKMGVYSNVLAPPSFGFWAVTVISILISGGLFINGVNDKNQNNDTKSFKAKTALGLFVFLFGMTLIHFFGDQRVFGWIYSPQERSSPLFAPVGLVTCLLACAEFAILIAALRFKSGVSALISMAVTLLAFQFVTGVPIIPTMFQNWVTSLVVFTGYLAVGIFWFLWKWDGYVKSQRAKYNVVYEKWRVAAGIAENTVLSLQQKADFESYFHLNGRDEDERKIEFRPKYRDHKSELIGWMMVWPISMFESFLFDILAEIFSNIYKRFGNILNAIMLKRWEGTEGHMLTKEERVLLAEEQKKK